MIPGSLFSDFKERDTRVYSSNTKIFNTDPYKNYDEDLGSQNMGVLNCFNHSDNSKEYEN
jgi:hypothetical protein